MTIVFGQKSNPTDIKIKNQIKNTKQLKIIKDKVINQKSITKWVETSLSNFGDYFTGYYTAICDLNLIVDGKEYIDGAFGYSTNRLEATLKCMSEGYERFACTQFKFDFYGNVQTSGYNYLDPNFTYPINPDFYTTNPSYQKFIDSQDRYYVAGTSLKNNQTCMIPVELVYFPISNQKLGYQKHIFANSTGAASHFEEELAIKSGILECIERDAFALTWYCEDGFYKLDQTYWPLWLKQKSLEWNKLGYTIYIIDITKDSLPVVLCVLYAKDKIPSLGTGCACRVRFEDALESAFLECEQGFINWLKNGHKIPKVSNPKEITRAWHHPAIYAFGENYDKIQFLLESDLSPPKIKIPKKFTKVNEQGLLNKAIQKFDFIKVVLAQKENDDDLIVTKIISKELMPLNFGFGNEPYNHSRVTKLGYKWLKNYPAFPHFFP
jgi:thiazole/oxazole-forming peptide maturase SagD family component